MNLVYAGEIVTPEQKENTCIIFLAGPTPRDETVPSWRTQDLFNLYKDHPITFIIPELRSGFWSDEHQSDAAYQNQVDWEWTNLHLADAIVFWVPRHLETMPAFTTNVEFGFWAAKGSQKVVLGYPFNAPKMRYLDSLARRLDIPVYNSIRDTIGHAYEIADKFRTVQK